MLPISESGQINSVYLNRKYKAPDNQGEILPNILGLKNLKEINAAEFEGFLRAEIYLSEHLTSRTKFNSAFILKTHKMALGHLYAFAGKLRDVNLSKGGFPFAAAKYLPETMSTFENEILVNLPNKY